MPYLIDPQLLEALNGRRILLASQPDGDSQFLTILLDDGAMLTLTAQFDHNRQDSYLNADLDMAKDA